MKYCAKSLSLHADATAIIKFVSSYYKKKIESLSALRQTQASSPGSTLSLPMNQPLGRIGANSSYKTQNTVEFTYNVTSVTILLLLGFTSFFYEFYSTPIQ